MLDPKGPINNMPALVQIGAKPFSEPMMTWFADVYMSLLASMG